jgi:hypothetical protein
LKGVTIPGDDQHIPAVFNGSPGERGDDVVCLEALQPELVDLKSLEYLIHQRKLASEVIGRLLSLRLVLGVDLGAERLSGDIPGNGDPVGVKVLEQSDQARYAIELPSIRARVGTTATLLPPSKTV